MSTHLQAKCNMEHSQKFMWLRRTPFSASMNNSFNQTWEDIAYAEDTNGTLGHCIWPPRSYSCTFCKREFRSAQALGGHMNIHRRERAMFKQSTWNHQHPGINSSTRSSALSYHFIKHCSSDNSLIAQEPQRFFTQAAQTSSGVFGVTFLKPDQDKNAVGENDLFYQSCDPTSVNISHKRARTGFSSLSSILNPCAAKNWHSHVEEGITESNFISTEGLDLELRLGDLPRVD